jgi:hypothetical protein
MARWVCELNYLTEWAPRWFGWLVGGLQVGAAAERIGLDETGVVATVSQILEARGISLLYWSTFRWSGAQREATRHARDHAFAVVGGGQLVVVR